MKPLSATESKNLIRDLTRLDLDKADYEYIQRQINRLLVGIPLTAITPRNDTRLYRGVVYKEGDKPTLVSQLSYPPRSIVTDFQRCNSPNNPMFYCSVDPASVCYELELNAGDKIYFSKWSVINDFWVNQIGSMNPDTIDHRIRDIIFTFFEAMFLSPIHETYSSRYKITSAIAENLSRGQTNEPKQREVGAITYPSVKHTGRSENLAIRPTIVDTCLQLDHVEEYLIKKVDRDTIEYDRIDFSSRFPNGEIVWDNKVMYWEIASGSQLTFTAERGDWVVRDINGDIVNPGNLSS